MDYTKTLLNETIHAITYYAEKTPAKVDWVGSADGEYAIEWDEFTEIADFQYNSGYGSEEVASDLVVVFTDGTWLERGEYDGSEWWDYKHPPRRATNPKKLRTVQVVNYENSLARLNQDQ